MKNQHASKKQIVKVASSVCLLGAILFIIFLVPPTNRVIIFLTMILIGIFTYIISTFFIRKRYALVLSTALIVFLTINSIAGFHVLNTLLLVSVIIGIILLIRDKNP